MCVIFFHVFICFILLKLLFVIIHQGRAPPESARVGNEAQNQLSL